MAKLFMIIYLWSSMVDSDMEMTILRTSPEDMLKPHIHTTHTHPCSKLHSTQSVSCADQRSDRQGQLFYVYQSPICELKEPLLYMCLPTFSVMVAGKRPDSYSCGPRQG